MSLCVVIINGASAAPLTAQVTTAWLARVADACQMQLDSDVAGYYGDGPYGVRVGSGPSDVQPGEMVFAIVDDLPQAPGAIAYHDVTGADVPVAFLALSTCNSLDDVSVAISHELCETAGDLACNLWADDGNGYEWARELCDAVESNRYSIDLGDGNSPIIVSDFLLPSFFAANAPAPFTWMQAQGYAASSVTAYPIAPFDTATGGYQIQRQTSANVNQVTAKSEPGIVVNGDSKRGLLAYSGKHSWSSRPARRGVPRK